MNSETRTQISKSSDTMTATSSSSELAPHVASRACDAAGATSDARAAASSSPRARAAPASWWLRDVVRVRPWTKTAAASSYPSLELAPWPMRRPDHAPPPRPQQIKTEQGRRQSVLSACLHFVGNRRSIDGEEEEDGGAGSRRG